MSTSEGLVFGLMRVLNSLEKFLWLLGESRNLKLSTQVRFSMFFGIPNRLPTTIKNVILVLAVVQFSRVKGHPKAIESR